MIGAVSSIALSVVSALLVFILQGAIRENRQLRQTKKADADKKEQAISDGVQSLLRIQLIEYHDKYMRQDSIPTYAYENWDDMFGAYKALGGNGAISRMNEDISHKRLGGKNEDH